MGNQIVGNMFASGAAAVEPYIGNFNQNEAEAALNRIWDFVKSSYYFSTDAEFGDYTKPTEPLGRLLIKVFDFENYEKWENTDWEQASDNDWEAVGNATYTQFRNKYEFS